MPLATLKDKGQITLPAGIRKQLNAGKGDIFDCEVVEGKIVMTLKKLVPVQESREARQVREQAPEFGTGISKYFGTMAGQFGSVEEIDEFIRDERASWD